MQHLVQFWFFCGAVPSWMSRCAQNARTLFFEMQIVDWIGAVASLPNPKHLHKLGVAI